MTEREFDIIEDAIDNYCMDCHEDTLNDETICEKCHIRKFMDKIHEIKD